MDFFEKIKSFFKKIFGKEEIKLLNESIKQIENKYKNEENEFLKSLRVNIEPEYRKNKIETLICVGDGTGIQTKLNW